LVALFSVLYFSIRSGVALSATEGKKYYANVTRDKKSPEFWGFFVVTAEVSSAI
jgi:hypothetical protein